MKRFLILFILFFPLLIMAQIHYPAKVEAALKESGRNKTELIKALNFFYKTRDSLKIKCINFLIGNMPVHSSYNYYWADYNGQRVEFNELNYSSFNDAVTAFNQLKKTHPKLHPVVNIYRDIDSIKGDYLIKNVEQAISAWQKRNGKLPTIEDGTLETFLEYELPYRVSIEPIENWRNIYAIKYKHIFKGNASTDSLQLRHVINSSFKNIWSREAKTEPLPRLSALQIQLRGKGYCEDIADMAVFIARSQGIAAAVDNVPLWATTAGEHFSDFLFFDKKHFHFDAVLDSLGREPGKVLRTTYSPQPDAIATWMDTATIPAGFLRIKNYKDVTRQYWPAGNITCKLFTSPQDKQQVSFLAVFNGGKWLPVWYGKISGGIAVYKNMSKGVVYLPMYYHDKKLIPAGWPQALGYNNAKELQPDIHHTQTIQLHEQEKYIKFRAGKKYQLLMWNNQWQLLGEQTAEQGCTQLTFKNIPANTLLLLAPEYSQGKERPFIITENGKRVWL
jgi:hypothetical protein